MTMKLKTGSCVTWSLHVWPGAVTLMMMIIVILLDTAQWTLVSPGSCLSRAVSHCLPDYTDQWEESGIRMLSPLVPASPSPGPSLPPPRWLSGVSERCPGWYLVDSWSWCRCVYPIITHSSLWLSSQWSPLLPRTMLATVWLCDPTCTSPPLPPPPPPHIHTMIMISGHVTSEVVPVLTIITNHHHWHTPHHGQQWW